MTQQATITQDGSIDQFEEDYRPLTESEIEEILYINPHIKVDKVIVLASGYINVESYNDEICTYLDCLELEETKVYDNITGVEIKQLSLDVNLGKKEKESVCFTENTTCSLETKLIATYNCLGWAIGIAKWLSPSVIDNYIKDGFTKDEAVRKFITFYHEQFPDTHPANFEQFSGRLNVLSSKPEVITNNTIIFYFRGDKATHAARYIEDFGDNQAINQWTSKMGPEALISHQECEELAPSFFGNEFVYVGIE